MKRIKNGFLSIAALFGFLLFTGCSESEYASLENGLYIANATTLDKTDIRFLDDPTTIPIVVRTAIKAQQDILVTIVIDSNYVEQYNTLYQTEYALLPDSQYEIDTLRSVIPAGSISTTFFLTLKPLVPELNMTGLTYVLPISIGETVNAPIILGSSRTFLAGAAPLPYSYVPQVNNGSNSTYAQMLLNGETPLSTFTLECLIYFNGAGGTNSNAGNIFGAGSTTGGVNLHFRLGDAGARVNHINGNIGGRYDLAGAEILRLYRWDHFAYVWSYDTQTHHFYINGVENIPNQGNAKSWSDLFTFPADGFTLGITGTASPLATRPCRYSEVRLWNYRRTPEQIRNNMLAVPPDSPGLVGYWKLNEPSGSEIIEATGKHPNGRYVRNSATVVPDRFYQRVELGATFGD